MIKVGVFDEKTREFSIMEIEDSLDDYYKIIGCNYIDIVERKIFGKWFDVICDDEGLLKENPTVTAIDAGFNPMLVGTLIFAHHDAEGHMTSIEDEEEAVLELATQTGYVWPCEYL